MVVVHLVLVLERLRLGADRGRRPAAAAGRGVHRRHGRFACARWAPATSPFPRRFAALRPGYTSAAWPTRRRWRRADGDGLGGGAHGARLRRRRRAIGALALAALRAGGGGGAGGTDARQQVAAGRLRAFRQCHTDTTEAMMSEPLDWSYRTCGNPGGGPAPNARCHRGGARASVAAALEVVSCEQLEAEFAIRAIGKGHYRLAGKVAAPTDAKLRRHARSPRAEGRGHLRCRVLAGGRVAGGRRGRGRGAERGRDRADRARPHRCRHGSSSRRCRPPSIRIRAKPGAEFAADELGDAAGWARAGRSPP